MNLIERLKSPTPRFFKKVMALGIAIFTIGTGIVALELDIPAIIEKIGEHLIVAGSILTIIGKSAVDFDKVEQNNK